MSSSRGREQYPPDSKVFVGNLSQNTNRYELEDAFREFGPVRNVWVARNPPGFAFIQYGDKRDADDAIRTLNNRTVCGRRVHVALSEENRGLRRGGSRGGPRGGGRDISNEKCFECGKRGHFARDCFERRARGGRRRSRSRSRSRSPPRYQRRSHSKSRSPKRKAHSRSKSHSASQSPERKAE